MSYHHWSNARGANLRTYDGQGNRSNFSHFNHANYQNQHGHQYFRHGMRQQQGFYNDEEVIPTLEHNDASNEAFNGYPELHRNDSQNNDEVYRNYFPRHHHIPQESPFHDNMQLWNSRIFTSSDHSPSESSYPPPGLVQNSRENNENNVDNPNAPPLYSDVAGNFNRENYNENEGACGIEPFAEEIEGGYIASNVGYMSATSCFKTPMNFIPNYTYQTTNDISSTPTPPENNNNNDESIRNTEDTQTETENFNQLDDFPTLSSTIHNRNNSKNRKALKKQRNINGNTQRSETQQNAQFEKKTTEQPNFESRESYNKKVLEQHQQVNYMQQLQQKIEKQDQQQKQQQQQQQQEQQLQGAAFYQIYQQHSPTKESTQSQMQQQQPYMQFWQHQPPRRFQEYHQHQSPQNQQQDQLHQVIESQSNINNHVFHPINLQHHENHQSIFYPNQSNIFPEMHLNQRQLQLRERDYQIQQQQQQLSFLHYQQQAAQHHHHHHQLQQLQNRFMLPSNLQRQPNGQDNTNEQYTTNLTEHNSQMSSPRWPTLMYPMRQYAAMQRRSDDNNDHQMVSNSSFRNRSELNLSMHESSPRDDSRSQSIISSRMLNSNTGLFQQQQQQKHGPQTHRDEFLTLHGIHTPFHSNRNELNLSTNESSPREYSRSQSLTSAKMLNLQQNHAPQSRHEEFLSLLARNRENDSKGYAASVSGTFKYSPSQYSNFQVRPSIEELNEQNKQIDENCLSTFVSSNDLPEQRLPSLTTKQLTATNSFQADETENFSSLEHFSDFPKISEYQAAQSNENVPQYRYTAWSQDPNEQQQQQKQHLKSNFSSILISSKNLDNSTKPTLPPEPPIFEMRMEDFPALPCRKSRISKKLNTSISSDDTQTTTETLVPLPKGREIDSERVDSVNVNNFLASLKKHCEAQHKQDNQRKPGTYKPPKKTLKVWPNNIISNIPPTMLTDQYGIAGLYSAYKAAEKDPNIARLTYGIDLETLGLDLRSKEPLLPNFKGPFAGECDPLNSSSNEFPVFPKKQQNKQTKTNNNSRDNEESSDSFTITPDLHESLAPPNMEILSDADLFYIFYKYVRDLLQLRAANELYNRAWVFYIKEKVWITRHPDRPYQQKGKWERGHYIYYDHEECKCSLKFMKIDTSKIDDRPTIPPIYRDNRNSSSSWSTTS